jgi:hypothetical protein
VLKRDGDELGRFSELQVIFDLALLVQPIGQRFEQAGHQK